jgi:hypothetical protein
MNKSKWGVPVMPDTICAIDASTTSFAFALFDTKQGNLGVVGKIYFDGKNGVQNMPLRELSHINNNGTPYSPLNTNTNGILAFSGQRITWTKSFISFPTVVTTATSGVLIIGVYYQL